MTTNAEKLEAARAWMAERGIKIQEGGWRGPANPIPNLANKQPTIACYDCGMIGQWKSVLRMLVL